MGYLRHVLEMGRGCGREDGNKCCILRLQECIVWPYES
jgi:hypothetical protein